MYNIDDLIEKFRSQQSETLDLSGYNLSTKPLLKIKEVARLIRSSDNLKNINFSRCSLGKCEYSALEELFHAISESKIKSLDLSGNDIGSHEKAAKIFNTLQCNTLEELDLDENNLSFKGINSTTLDYLSKNQNLKSLSLRYNKLGELEYMSFSRLKTLFTSLTKLESLDVGFNELEKLEDKSVGFLVTYLLLSKQLKKLCLDGCVLTSFGTPLLSLLEHSSIEVLSLSECDFFSIEPVNNSELFIETFFLLVRKNNQLKHLSFSNNQLGASSLLYEEENKTLQIFIEFIKQYKKLVDIDLSRNELSTEIIHKLIKSIPNRSELKLSQKHFDYNMIPDEKLRELLSMRNKKKNTHSSPRLFYSNNPILEEEKKVDELFLDLSTYDISVVKARLRIAIKKHPKLNELFKPGELKTFNEDSQSSKARH